MFDSLNWTAQSCTTNVRASLVVVVRKISSEINTFSVLSSEINTFSVLSSEINTFSVLS